MENKKCLKPPTYIYIYIYLNPRKSIIYTRSVVARILTSKINPSQQGSPRVVPYPRIAAKLSNSMPIYLPLSPQCLLYTLFLMPFSPSVFGSNPVQSNAVVSCDHTILSYCQRSQLIKTIHFFLVASWDV